DAQNTCQLPQRNRRRRFADRLEDQQTSIETLNRRRFFRLTGGSDGSFGHSSDRSIAYCAITSATAELLGPNDESWEINGTAQVRYPTACLRARLSTRPATERER